MCQPLNKNVSQLHKKLKYLNVLHILGYIRIHFWQKEKKTKVRFIYFFLSNVKMGQVRLRTACEVNRVHNLMSKNHLSVTQIKSGTIWQETLLTLGFRLLVSLVNPAHKQECKNYKMRLKRKQYVGIVYSSPTQKYLLWLPGNLTVTTKTPGYS